MANDHDLGLHELNSLITFAGGHRSLFKGYAEPGFEATSEAVEGITGLKINYYGMINLMGFRKLVEAVGGIKLHVRERIPIGGIGSPISGWIKPGYRKLDGYQALWFARSRVAADDYSRMARQKCVMAAMLQQISPEKVVLNFSKIAKASESTFETNLPQSEVDRFAALALKARGKPISTVSFVPPVITTAHPDITKIHAMVAKAISGKHSRKRHHAAPPTTEVGGSLGDLQQGYAANQSSNLAADC
jgi:LCP family protein required for cell wall assembly